METELLGKDVIRQLLREKKYTNLEKKLVGDAQAAAKLRVLAGKDKAALNALADDPIFGAEARSQLGMVWLGEKNFVEAKSSFALAFQQDPLHFRARGNYGNVLLEENDLQNAISIYLSILEADPQNSSVNYNLGIAYRRAGNYANSVKYLRIGERLNYREQLGMKPNQIQSKVMGIPVKTLLWVGIALLLFALVKGFQR